MPTIVFHTPFPLQPTRPAASAQRPIHLQQAFTELGYRVLSVTGRAAERRAAIARVRAHLAVGGRLDFAYSEAATLPTWLTEPHHLPLHPRLDLPFLASLAAHGVPVGLYYRDIYWQFPEYRERVGPLVATTTIALYRHDLRAYDRFLTRLYLPSREMAAHVPHVAPSKMTALPPGTTLDLRDWSAPRGPLRLLYVGALGTHYRLHAALAALAATPAAHLTLCTPAANWHAASPTYPPLPPNVTLVHAAGAALAALYRPADLGLLLVEPHPYRDFAMPYKLFEYLGRGLPIIATAGTLAGRFVAAHGLGWAIDYTAAALQQLLARLAAAPTELAAVAARVRQVAPAHTWQARARQVRADLAPSA
ncbi:glycosyltransferase family protein [Buchananella hordeovulneris]|uniref:glycosyltransferase family protein n=1 Tax=Buchananella hordeovulneris TaxID=52770 RepID=UPI000F5DA13D|nr:glycosyltransferase [Buchananella hordeovulneris]MDO5079788.1 glycosyl transferase [Buchananella hordeovulneris]RRD44534.1 glycosyl transferase [Buchananella hordeovulneris]